jgi:hypothetical protein
MPTLCGQTRILKTGTFRNRPRVCQSDGSVTFWDRANHSKWLSILRYENRHLISERSPVNMKTNNSVRLRASRFLSDRYAYRERPDYLIELVAFGIIIITLTLSLANAMATTLK